MTVLGMMIAAVLAAPGSPTAPVREGEGDALVRPPFPQPSARTSAPRDDASIPEPGKATTRPGAKARATRAQTAAARRQDVERQEAERQEAERQEAERKEARQPKDLRNPFLLARIVTSKRTRHAAEHDLRHPFGPDSPPLRGSGAQPRDLRDPFDRAHATPPLDVPPKEDRCQRGALVPGEVMIQRPRALERQLCGSASARPQPISPAFVAAAQPVGDEPSKRAS